MAAEWEPFLVQGGKVDQEIATFSAKEPLISIIFKARATEGELELVLQAASGLATG